MQRGSYDVYSPVKTNANSNGGDSNFWKTFSCSILVLAVLALIIFLIAVPLTKDDSEIFDIDIRGNSEYYKGKNDSTHEIKDNNLVVNETQTPFEYVEDDDDGDFENSGGNNDTEWEKGVHKTNSTHEKLTSFKDIVYKNKSEVNKDSYVTTSSYNEIDSETLSESNIINENNFSYTLDSLSTVKSVTDFDYSTITYMEDQFNEFTNNNDSNNNSTVTTNDEMNYSTSMLEDKSYTLDSLSTVKSVTDFDYSRITYMEDQLNEFTNNNDSNNNSTVTTNYEMNYSTSMLEDKSNTSIVEWITTTTPAKTTTSDIVSRSTMLIDKCSLSDDKKYCITEECKRISSKALSLMSLSETPCLNYYNYACEGISQNYIHESDTSKEVVRRIKVALDGINDTSKEYSQIYKKYYETCVQYEVVNGLQKVKEVFNSLGYVFYDEKADLSQMPELEDLIIDLLKNNLPALFDIRVEPEYKTDNASFSLTLEPVFYEDFLNNLIGDSKKYEEVCIKETLPFINGSSGTSSEFYLAYQECNQKLFMADVQKALSNLDKFMGAKNQHIKNILFDFEQLFIKQSCHIDIPERKRIRADKLYEFLSLSYVSSHIPQIDWEYIINKIMEIDSIDGKMKIQIYHLNYLGDSLLNIGTSNIPTDPRRKYHNSLLALYAYKLYKDYILSQTRQCDRSEYCINLSNKLMNDVGSYLYLQTFTNEEITMLDNYAKRMFNEVNDNIETKHLYNKDSIAGWKKYINSDVPEQMTSFTYSKIKPWTDEKDLDKRFVHVNMTSANFIDNTIELERRHRRLMYELLPESPLSPNNLWTAVSSPIDTKPRHYWHKSSSTSFIVIPLAAIPSVRYFATTPSYITMSDLGFALAKEIIYCYLTPQMHINVMNDFNTNILFDMPNHDESPVNVYVNISSPAIDMLSSVYAASHAYEAYLESKLQTKLFNKTLIWQDISADKTFFLLLAQQFCKKETIFDNPLTYIESETLPPIFTVNSIVLNSNHFEDLYQCTNPVMIAGINITEIELDYKKTSAQMEG